MVTAPGRDEGAAAGWPEALVPVFEQAVTVELATLTQAGVPVMTPLTPFLGEGRTTLDVSTGVAYPAKAERARRRPEVCLLFSDPVGSGVPTPPVVLVQGLATVRDADVQANTDRYVRLSTQKLPEAYAGMPAVVLRRIPAYFARIWISVTPLRMTWWPSSALDVAPEEWRAPASTSAAPSDPAPPGRRPSAWKAAPASWRAVLRSALGRLPQRDLAWVGPDGFPCAVPVLDVEEAGGAVTLGLGPHLPSTPSGPATLTFHSHPASFTGQENHTFVGTVRADHGVHVFEVERVLGDFSLAGNRLLATAGFLRSLHRLRPRLASELARRGQPVPRINLV